nr:VF530 family protein [Shimwellia pseudoproteus]
MNHTSNDPLHGMTLEAILQALLARYGWDELARHININCFKNDPSVKSSLKFLRRTPWARKAVETLYLDSLADNPPPEDDPWGGWREKQKKPDAQ